MSETGEPRLHNPHVCLGCGGTIRPDQDEIEVVNTRAGKTTYKGSKRFRHASDEDCAWALAHAGDRWKPWPRRSGKRRAAHQGTVRRAHGGIGP